jgi:hypothetical protein
MLDNRLTDGGEVVSPTHPPHFTTQGLVQPEGLGTFKNSNVYETMLLKVKDRVDH